MLNGLFSNPGQGQANNQNKRVGKVSSGFNDVFQQQKGQYGDILGMLGHLHASGALSGLLNGINQDPAQRIQQFGAGATEHAANDGMQYGHILKAMGYGDGAIAGQAQGAFQNAAHETNAYAAQQMDPQEQQRRIQSFLQALQSIHQTYGGAMGQSAQGVYGAPIQQSQNPLAGILGQAAGGWASMAGK